MIKANELRVGNWIKYAAISKDGQPFSGTSTAQALDEGQPPLFDRPSVITRPEQIRVAGYWLPPERIDGIPLTPEVLEKCGFKDRSGTMANRWSFGIDLFAAHEICWYIQDGFIRYQSKGEGFSSQMGHIIYVHQLQNLYFSFTSKELPVKLVPTQARRLGKDFDLSNLDETV